MTKHQKQKSRAWQRKDAAPGTGPADVLKELQRRQLTDLATCQAVWEHEQDPGAVLEALRRVDLPDWLRSALVVLVTDGEVFDIKPLRRKLFRDRAARLIERGRAFQIAGVRSQTDATWDQSFVVAKRLNENDFPTAGLGVITPAGMKRAYQRVARTLQAHPFSYYVHMPGLQDFIAGAWSTTIEGWRAALKSRKDGPAT